jgi:hypothetical protein
LALSEKERDQLKVLHSEKVEADKRRQGGARAVEPVSGDLAHFLNGAGLAVAAAALASGALGSFVFAGAATPAATPAATRSACVTGWY